MAEFYIFQSYSHQDWTPPTTSFQVSRLSEFISFLQQKLRTGSLRSNFRWMRDKDGLIRFGDHIDTAVDDAISACDIGVVALSEAYVESESTTYEFDCLVTSGKPFFVIGLEPLSEALLTRHNWMGRVSQIRQNLVCELFLKDSGSPDRERLLGFPIPDMDKEYAQKFYEYAHHLGQDIISKGQQLLVERNEVEEHGALDDCYDVLILAPSPDAVDFVDQLSDMLDTHSLSVARLTVDKLNSTSLKHAIDSAKMSIQVFGTMEGRKIDGVAATIFQYKFACAMGKRPSVWLSPNARITEDLHPTYRDFVAGTEHDTRALDQFAASVRKKVMRLREEVQIALEYGVPENEPFVVIDAHPEDLQIGAIFQDGLTADIEGAPIVSFLQEGNECLQQTRQLLESSLIHAVLMLYGPSDAGRKRLTNRLPFYRQSAALGRTAQRRALAVGDPNRPDVAPGPRGGGLYTLKLNNDCLEPEEIRQFMEHLNQIAGSAVREAANEPAE